MADPMDEPETTIRPVAVMLGDLRTTLYVELSYLVECLNDQSLSGRYMAHLAGQRSQGNKVLYAETLSPEACDGVGSTELDAVVNMVQRVYEAFAEGKFVWRDVISRVPPEQVQ
jgi:hypothetical protein